VTGSAWSTTSTAFVAPTDVQSVQIIYHLYHNGQLQINGLYLEPRDNVYVKPAVSGANNIPTSDFSAGEYDKPNDWLTYHAGDNNAAFSYQQADDGNFVQLAVSDYKNGEAKWQYTPQTVQAHTHYQFSVEYLSNTSVPVIAEYVLANGTRQEQTITDLPPTDQWTTATHEFEVPADATTLFVSLPLRHNGTLSTRNYQLVDTTRPGSATWQQPVVSLTFDDGWQQSYNYASPLLKQYGYKATFYINPTTIETPHFMTAAELSTLSNTGNEIGAHGHEHVDLTTLKNSAVDYQLQEGRDYLRTAGFQVTNLATPYGRSDPEVEWYARKYFTTMRGNANGINTRQNFDPYNLKVLYVHDSTSEDAIEKALRETKAASGWLILVYHQIDDKPSPGKGLPVENATISPKQFGEQLQQINASGIQVLPVAAAYTELEQNP
jgi:peptidoglycan/xylan/chitin deacetylase (PgdA/CDA1 family)